MKKLLLAMTLALVLTTNTVMAAGIGYVDYAKVSTSYSLAKKYTSDLDKKLDDIKQYATTQDTKIKNAKTNEERVQINKDSLAQINAKQKEYVAARNKYETELLNKVVLASDKVRVQKKLDIIIKKDSRVTGGIDCTQDVLNLLK